MARKSDRKALGRGLSALLADAELPTKRASEGVESRPDATIPIDLINANPNQPRQTFDEGELAELAASVKRHGLIQPVVVRPDPENQGQYQIVAGERRWRAAQRARLHELPAVVRTIDDQQLLELAIIENVQRVDLNPVEEASGYTQLQENFGYTQAELADVIGKSRSHVANTTRLLALPEQILGYLKEKKLSAGHARALINAPDPISLAEQAVIKGLTVRQVEELSRKDPDAVAISRKAAPKTKDADTRQLEGDLSAALKMKVTIDHAPGGGGEIRIRYQDLDQLDQLCEALSGP